MTHLKIIQNNTLADTEEVSQEIIQKLYDLAINENLDTSSEMKGRLHLTAGYRALAEYLHQMFPNLIISIDNYIIPFEDPNMVTYLNSIGVGSNGVITEAEAAAATIVSNASNSTVTKFNELKYFTSITQSRGGVSSSNNGWVWFYNWTALEEVDISNFISIGHDNGYGYGDTFCECSALQKVVASNKLQTIGWNAFKNCTNLEEISNLDGVITLYGNSFYNCKKLKNESFSNVRVLFPTQNNGDIFVGCEQLTSITLDNSNTIIPSGCFYGSSLSNINFPTGLTEIGASAFAETNLVSVDLSGLSIQEIKYQCFYECYHLTTVVLPNTCTIINNRVFAYTPLSSINLDHVVTIGQDAFAGCRNLETVTFGNVTSIGNGAFYDSGLTGNLVLSNLTSLGSTAFRGSHLTSIDFTGSTFTTVEGDLFSMCINQLDHVIFPSTVTSVKKDCFYNCQHLSYIVFPTTSTITWEDGRAYFTNVPSSCIMYVADSKVSEVTTALSGKFNGQIKGISEMPSA